MMIKNLFKQNCKPGICPICGGCHIGCPAKCSIADSFGQKQRCSIGKTNRLLTRLYENGEISNDDYELSIEEPLTRSTTARLFVLSMASMWLEKARDCDAKAGNFDAIEKTGG